MDKAEAIYAQATVGAIMLLCATVATVGMAMCLKFKMQATAIAFTAMMAASWLAAIFILWPIGS